MEEKRPPSDTSSDTESGEGTNDRRRICRRSKSKCDGRLWIFLVLGAFILVLGIVIGGLYFNIRTLTESTEFTEVTPTYVSAIAVLCSALTVALLFWRRLTCLVFLCVITCTITAFLCGVTAILTGTHVVRPILHFTQCFYFVSMRECHCNSPYKRNMLEVEFSPHDPSNIIFREAESCESIEEVLLHLLYALIGTYVLSFILTVGAAILSLLVLRMEKIRMGMFEDDTYEEIFTVSNSSGTPVTSDTDNEHQHMLHSVEDSRIPESRIISRSRSFSQPKFPTMSEPPTVEKSVPKVTVSGPSEQQGKLKDHRRRDRRAVTLHNLDTHQLMVILSLQMRYLQENENAKSQTTLNAQQLSQQLRRALTPQPTQDRQNQDIRQVRSHTPQPYHFKNRASFLDDTVPNYENMFDPSEFIRQMKQEKSQNVNKVPAERELCPQATAQSRPKTPRQGYGAQTIPIPQARKGNKTPTRLNYYEEIDDMADCLDDSSASDQIYENQSEACPIQRRRKVKVEGQVPGHVVCNGSAGQRDVTNILPALYPSIPRHLFDRSQTPTRPKSYLNAVDPSDSPQLNRRDHGPNGRAEEHNLTRQPQNTQIEAETDIYAMPVKSKQPPPKPARTLTPTWQANQQRPSLPGQHEGRSAFHAVPRSKNTKQQQWSVPPESERLQVSTRPIESSGNLEIQGQSNHVSNVSAFFPPPPYSPPPSYTDVMTHSRDSSLHSLTSSTSTSDDVDFYQQIRKPIPSHPQEPTQTSQPSKQQCPQNPVLTQIWANSSTRPESIPYSGPPPQQMLKSSKPLHRNGSVPNSHQNGYVQNLGPSHHLQKKNSVPNEHVHNQNSLQNGYPGKQHSLPNGYPGKQHSLPNGYPGKQNSPSNGYPGKQHSLPNGYPGKQSAAPVHQEQNYRRKDFENFEQAGRVHPQTDIMIPNGREITEGIGPERYGAVGEGDSSDSDCMETVI